MNIKSVRIPQVKRNGLTNGNSPAVLYHASPTNNLKEIVPLARTIRDPEEGAVVFATPDLAYATMFLVPTDDGWISCGLLNNVHYMVISDKKKFRKLDKGGTIYALPSYSFYCDLGKGGREKEWVSRVPVKPQRADFYPRALEAMVNYGVQVYFVDKETFTKIKGSGDHGLSILRDIESVNKKLGINIRAF